MREITADCGSVQVIGIRHENGRTVARIPLGAVADIVAEYPGGSFTLGYRRRLDNQYWVCSDFVVEGDELIWTVGSHALGVAGDVIAQVSYSDGTVIAQTPRFRFTVGKSLFDGEEGQGENLSDLVEQAITAVGQVDGKIAEAEEELDAAVAEKIDGALGGLESRFQERIDAAIEEIGEHIDLSGKADKADTVLDTTLSRGRKANSVVGERSFAFGNDVTASGNNSHAEGQETVASGVNCHAEGNYTTASENTCHAEGLQSTASGSISHAEGNNTTASGAFGHSEGSYTKASGLGSHAEGTSTTASGPYSHAEGNYSTAAGPLSHAEGHSQTTEEASSGHAEGNNTTVSAPNGHAEGNVTTASGTNSHAEGSSTKALGTNSHTEGSGTIVTKDASGGHAEGLNSRVIGSYGHAEGSGTYAGGVSSHAEGNTSSAIANMSHAEGSGTEASGETGHAEGVGTTASGANSHAENNATTASGANSHAEGNSTKAAGDNSHAEGRLTRANGDTSHAGGLGTITYGPCQTAVGRYNMDADGAECSDIANWVSGKRYEIGEVMHDNLGMVYRCKEANSDTTFDSTKWGYLGTSQAVFMVGNGSGTDARSTAFRVLWNGSIVLGNTVLSEANLQALLALLN